MGVEVPARCDQNGRPAPPCGERARDICGHQVGVNDVGLQPPQRRGKSCHRAHGRHGCVPAIRNVEGDRLDFRIQSRLQRTEAEWAYQRGPEAGSIQRVDQPNDLSFGTTGLECRDDVGDADASSQRGLLARAGAPKRRLAHRRLLVDEHLVPALQHQQVPEHVAEPVGASHVSPHHVSD